MFGLATMPLRRRMIGSLIVVAGVLIVLLGFFVDLSGTDVGGGAPSSLSGLAGQIHSGLSTGGDTAANALRHVADHGLNNASTVSRISDAAGRLGVVLMAAGALLALVLLLSPMRGFIGTAAGLGLLGLSLVTGVIAGTNTQVSDALSGAIHITIGRGVVICAAGFVVILAGGAVAALRPLAGLFSGIGLAVLGVGLGIGLAVLVGGDHILHPATG